jgi:hypothetical protein
MGIFAAVAGALNPVSMVETIKDENLKRHLETVGVNLAWSQYITALYSAADSFKGKFIVGLLSPVLRSLAASAYILLMDQQTQKAVNLAVPKTLVSDKTLLDSIQYVPRDEKGKS